MPANLPQRPPRSQATTADAPGGFDILAAGLVRLRPSQVGVTSWRTADGAKQHLGTRPSDLIAAGALPA